MTTDWDATLRSQLDALPTGRRVFNAPRVMREGTNTRVEFRVSRGDFSALALGLQGPGYPEIKEIKVAPLMSVSLKGEEEGGEPVFKIKPLGDADEQLVIGDQSTEWSWDVFPVRTGAHRLYLSVSVFLVPPDGGPRKKVKVEDRVVSAIINPSYRFKHYSGMLPGIFTCSFGLWLIQLLVQKVLWPYITKWRDERRPKIVLP